MQNFKDLSIKHKDVLFSFLELNKLDNKLKLSNSNLNNMLNKFIFPYCQKCNLYEKLCDIVENNGLNKGMIELINSMPHSLKLEPLEFDLHSTSLNDDRVMSLKKYFKDISLDCTFELKDIVEKQYGLNIDNHTRLLISYIENYKSFIGSLKIKYNVNVNRQFIEESNEILNAIITLLSSIEMQNSSRNNDENEKSLKYAESFLETIKTNYKNNLFTDESIVSFPDGLGMGDLIYSANNILKPMSEALSIYQSSYIVEKIISGGENMTPRVIDTCIKECDVYLQTMYYAHYTLSRIKDNIINSFVIEQNV